MEKLDNNNETKQSIFNEGFQVKQFIAPVAK